MAGKDRTRLLGAERALHDRFAEVAELADDRHHRRQDQHLASNRAAGNSISLADGAAHIKLPQMMPERPLDRFARADVRDQLVAPERMPDEVAAAVARHADGDDEGDPLRPFRHVPQPVEVRQQEAAVQNADGDRAESASPRSKSARRRTT